MHISIALDTAEEKPSAIRLLANALLTLAGAEVQYSQGVSELAPLKSLGPDTSYTVTEVRNEDPAPKAEESVEHALAALPKSDVQNAQAALLAEAATIGTKRRGRPSRAEKAAEASPEPTIHNDPLQQALFGGESAFANIADGGGAVGDTYIIEVAAVEEAAKPTNIVDEILALPDPVTQTVHSAQSAADAELAALLGEAPVDPPPPAPVESQYRKLTKAQMFEALKNRVPKLGGLWVRDVILDCGVKLLAELSEDQFVKWLEIADQQILAKPEAEVIAA